MDSGGGGHLSPTYREMDDENRLEDFRDEMLSAASSRDNLAAVTSGSTNNIPSASDSLAIPTLSLDRRRGSRGSNCSNNVKNIPSEISTSHLNMHHINNNNVNGSKSPSCSSNYRFTSGAAGRSDDPSNIILGNEHFNKIPSDVMYIDAPTVMGDTSSLYSERRSTLSSSVGEHSSTLSSRFRDSCDTVIPVYSNNMCNNGGGGSRLNSTADGVNIPVADESKNGSSNSDYGSFCATPEDRVIGANNKTALAGSRRDVNGGNSGGQPVDGYQNAPLLSDLEDDVDHNGDEGSGSSLGGGKRSRRGGGGRGDPVKIDLPSTSDMLSSTDDENGGGFNNEHIPHEPLKTLLAAFFLATGFVATTTSLAITHEHVPEIDPLPDVILDNVTYSGKNTHVLSLFMTK